MRCTMTTKNKSRASLAIILTLALIFTSVSFIPQAAYTAYADTDYTAELALEADFTTKAAVIWYLNEEEPSTDTMEIRYYNDLPHVPYIKINEMFGLLDVHSDSTTLAVERIDDHKFRLENTITLADAIVDTLEDTLYTYYIDEFKCQHNPGAVGENGETDSFAGCRNVGEEVFGDVNEYIIDFDDKYGIDLRSDGDSLYFPIATGNDVFGGEGGTIVMFDGEIVYAVNLWVYEDILARGSSAYNTYLDRILGGNSGNARPLDLAEFAYKDLCFELDFCYGYPGRELIHSKYALGQSLDEFLDGFTAVTESGDTVYGSDIKTLLTSTNWGEYFLGYYALDALLYDGGHTSADIYRGISRGVYTKIYNQLLEAVGTYPAIWTWLRERDDIADGIIIRRSVREEQREQGFGLQPGQTYIESGDTAIFLMDDFDCSPEGNQEIVAYYAGGARPDDDCEYAVVHFVNALNRAMSNPNIKYFVLDCTQNGGGYSDIAFHVFTIIDGNDSCYFRNKSRRTGKLCISPYISDRNFDGVINEDDDTYETGLEFILLQSECTFSAANEFSSLMEESGRLILGETSGGGSCAVQNLVTADGLRWYISGAGYVCCGQDPERDLDNGIPATINLFEHAGKVKDPSNPDYSDFYDIENLKSIIHSYYEPQPPSGGRHHSSSDRQDKAETVPVTEEITAEEAGGVQPAITASNISEVFSDITGSEWYAGSVAFAADHKFMQGIGGGTFNPEGTAQRAMIAQILFNMENGEEGGGTAFEESLLESLSDVTATDWFAAPIAWMLEAGIAKGQGRSFGATDPITREADIVMLQNYAKYKGIDTGKTADLSIFADADTISPWARDAVAWAVGEGLLTGYTDKDGRLLLNPAGTATRAQIATLIKRFYENILK